MLNENLRKKSYTNSQLEVGAYGTKSKALFGFQELKV
jgi:hypothetical protein